MQYPWKQMCLTRDLMVGVVKDKWGCFSFWTSHNSINAAGYSIYMSDACPCRASRWLLHNRVPTHRLTPLNRDTDSLAYFPHFPLMSGLISCWILTHTYWISQPWKMPFIDPQGFLRPSYALTYRVEVRGDTFGSFHINGSSSDRGSNSIV